MPSILLTWLTVVAIFWFQQFWRDRFKFPLLPLAIPKFPFEVPRILSLTLLRSRTSFLSGLGIYARYFGVGQLLRACFLWQSTSRPCSSQGSLGTFEGVCRSLDASFSERRAACSSIQNIWLVGWMSILGFKRCFILVFLRNPDAALSPPDVKLREKCFIPQVFEGLSKIGERVIVPDCPLVNLTVVHDDMLFLQVLLVYEVDRWGVGWWSLFNPLKFKFFSQEFFPAVLSLLSWAGIPCSWSCQVCRLSGESSYLLCTLEESATTPFPKIP